MNHIFQTSEEQYAKLAAYAAQRGQTPESLFEEWINAVTRETDKLPAIKQKKAVSTDEELLDTPLFQVAGIFAIGEPGWADKHDEYLAEAALEDHAEDE
jgi:hypothetical protein